ncbi:hypothetical protein NKR23_g10664 [Pleurostoma richardsiae]|uniref:Zn(2)-C6 fungal-type domain-containing protein n=1 Tax=Pleurostoma richardsiae TaxID=41990 RepID=A0AA38RDV3_9PEZI|nr:hypothetical protein NKR23_g10664 [Pleurostoma richardsiae]
MVSYDVYADGATSPTDLQNCASDAPVVNVGNTRTAPNLHVQGIQGDGRRFSRYQGPGGTKPAALTAESEQNSRQRTGCLTCRQRKTKCDGAKPECSNCIRGNFVCAGYPPRKGTWRMPAVGTREAGPTDETIQQRVEEEDEGYEVDDAEHLSKDKDVKKY